MEMRENNGANSRIIADSKPTSDDVENISVNEKNLKTHTTRSTKESENSGLSPAGRRCYRLTAVCLGLLCVLLLTGITVLWIKFTAERDQLLTSYTNLTIERDQLKTSYTSLTIERDQLKAKNTKLSEEKDHMESSYVSVMNERDELKKKLSSVLDEWRTI
ncbi:hypothetical protein MHYP_G00247350 [Metynnis hypsauchen]